jgi:hypothetical protein
MRKRKTAVLAAILLIVILVPIAGFFGAIWYVERQRVQDADPALKPLAPLGVYVLENPIAFNRYCCYIATFPPEANLSDTNVTELACLNKLPHRNRLDLSIQTRNVTDASLPYLKMINKLDSIDVTQTSISDKGIAELKIAFPKSYILERKPKTINKEIQQEELH